MQALLGCVFAEQRSHKARGSQGRQRGRAVPAAPAGVVVRERGGHGLEDP